MVLVIEQSAAPQPTAEAPAIVVGGGIAGVSCARVLADAGLAVRIIDRGKRLGGRMAVRHEQMPHDRPHDKPHGEPNHSKVGTRGRAVDIGAAYFTVRDPRFAAVVASWEARGLARVWTDTFDVVTLGGPASTSWTTGVPRWAAADGLRSLVEDLATGVPVIHDVEVEEVDVAGGLTVDGAPAAAVVLAMPEPQAYDLLPEPVAETLGLGRGLDWTSSIAVWAAWGHRWWPALDGAFVDGSPIVSAVADDGRRRGDDAPVLVVHTTGVFSADRLDDPESAVEPVLDELAAVFGVPTPPAPVWARAHRWSLASPRHPHDRPFALLDTSGDGLIGVCGDAWGPRARIEQAWVSGHELAHALVARWKS